MPDQQPLSPPFRPTTPEEEGSRWQSYQEPIGYWSWLKQRRMYWYFDRKVNRHTWGPGIGDKIKKHFWGDPKVQKIGFGIKVQCKPGSYLYVDLCGARLEGALSVEALAMLMLFARDHWDGKCLMDSDLPYKTKLEAWRQAQKFGVTLNYVPPLEEQLAFYQKPENGPPPAELLRALRERQQPSQQQPPEQQPSGQQPPAQEQPPPNPLDPRENTAGMQDAPEGADVPLMPQRLVPFPLIDEMVSISPCNAIDRLIVNAPNGLRATVYANWLLEIESEQRRKSRLSPAQLRSEELNSVIRYYNYYQHLANRVANRTHNLILSDLNIRLRNEHATQLWEDLRSFEDAAFVDRWQRDPLRPSYSAARQWDSPRRWGGPRS